MKIFRKSGVNQPGKELEPSGFNPLRESFLQSEEQSDTQAQHSAPSPEAHPWLFPCDGEGLMLAEACFSVERSPELHSRITFWKILLCVK